MRQQSFIFPSARGFKWERREENTMRNQINEQPRSIIQHIMTKCPVLGLLISSFIKRLIFSIKDRMTTTGPKRWKSSRITLLQLDREVK